MPLPIFAASAAAKLLPKLIGPAIVFAIGFAAAEAYEHKVPWGLAHKLEAARADRDEARLAFRDERAVRNAVARRANEWRAYGEANARLRVLEHGDAVKSVNAQQARCDARVRRAETSSRALQTLLSTGAENDEKGCPVRRLADPDVLRDAIGAR